MKKCPDCGLVMKDANPKVAAKMLLVHRITWHGSKGVSEAERRSVCIPCPLPRCNYHAVFHRKWIKDPARELALHFHKTHSVDEVGAQRRAPCCCVQLYLFELRGVQGVVAVLCLCARHRVLMGGGLMGVRARVGVSDAPAASGLCVPSFH